MRNATTKIKNLIMVMGSLSLVSCAGYGLDRYSTASIMPETLPNPGFEHSTTEEVPLSRAFVLFPDAVGQPVGVFETAHSNGISQKVVYYGEPATPGENFLDIRAVRGGGKSKAGANALTLHDNTARKLQQELRKVMPNADMRLSALVENNAYGTFGYALGTEYDGQNCIFAWQSIKGHVKAFDGLFRRFKNDRRAISIRARFCRSTFSRQNLVSMMRGMRIVLDPKDLDKREVVRWKGEGQGINSYGNPEALADGYVTEGVAGPNSVEMSQSFPEAPVVRSTPRAAAPRRVTSAKPRVTTKPRARTPAPVIERKPILPKRKKEPNYMERDDLRNLDPSQRLEVQTIYVDPRQYATVPAPSDVNVGTGQNTSPLVPVSRNTTGQRGGINGRVAPVRNVGEAGVIRNNNALVPSPNDSLVPAFGKQTISGATDDNVAVQSDQAGRKGDSDVHTVVSGRAGLPPDARQVKTSEWDRNNRSGGGATTWDGNAQSGWGEDRNQANKKDWVNDIARNDQTGIPLGRPCGIIRDSSCR